jgi:recombination protein RecA
MWKLAQALAGMMSLSKDIVEKVRDAFGKESALILGEGGSRSEVVEVIPTGIEVVDRYLFGCGGLPVGRITEVYSEEGSGKTSFALSCAGAAQKDGAVAILAETEGALSTERAQTFGVNLSELVLLQPSHMEEMLAQAEAAIKAVPKGAGPVLFIWDSIAATPTKREVEEGLAGEAAMAERARILSHACRHLPTLAMKKRVAFLFINQIRDKIGIAFGDKYTTPGGHAVKFVASIRMQLFGGKAVKNAEEHRGKDLTFFVGKNKLASPYRKARVRLDYEKGWDNTWTTLNHAKDEGVADERARGEKAYEEAREKLGWTDGK